MTNTFRPYWAALGHGGFLPNEHLQINSRETEQYYLDRGWTLTKTKRPYNRAAQVSAGPVANFTRSSNDTTGLQRLHVPDTHGGYIRGMTWPESCHHPEILPT